MRRPPRPAGSSHLATSPIDSCATSGGSQCETSKVAGVPRSVAMKLTGHKAEAVYRRYAIVAKSDLEEGVAKLAKLHGDRAIGR